MLHDLVAVSRPHGNDAGAARALEVQRVLEMFEGAMQTLARHLKTVWCVYAAVSDCKIIMKRLTVQWNNIKGTGEDLAGKFEQMVLALGLQDTPVLAEGDTFTLAPLRNNIVRELMQEGTPHDLMFLEAADARTNLKNILAPVAGNLHSVSLELRRMCNEISMTILEMFPQLMID